MDLSKLAFHTITNKPWSLRQCLDAYSDRGIGGISVWKDVYEKIGIVAAAELIKQYPIKVVSLVRGGFFAHTQLSNRIKAINWNKSLIQDAAEIDSPILVLVCGSDPNQTLAASRLQISNALDELLPYAQSLNVKLGIEPLHPMYADTKSAINSLHSANNICEMFESDFLGVVIDVYHLWWELNLEAEIKRCAQNGNLLALHLCDWKSPTTDLLNDRTIMGEGCIPIKEIMGWMKDAGFEGFHEVEIFSNHYWQTNQDEYVDKIVKSYNYL